MLFLTWVLWIHLKKPCNSMKNDTAIWSRVITVTIVIPLLWALRPLKKIIVGPNTGTVHLTHRANWVWLIKCFTPSLLSCKIALCTTGYSWWPAKGQYSARLWKKVTKQQFVFLIRTKSPHSQTLWGCTLSQQHFKLNANMLTVTMLTCKFSSLPS